MSITKRIGLMGGTLNPIHNGHITLARGAIAALQLDEVVFLPSARPPHKGVPDASPEQRLRMAELAAAEEPRMRVSDIELRRSGTTYTVDTLRELTLREPAEYTYLVGYDTLLDVCSWRESSEVARLCSFAAFPRAGISSEAVRREAAALTRDYSASVTLLDIPIPNVSSTELRARVHAGLALDGRTPDRVIDFIDRYRLYDPPQMRTRGECIAILKETLSPRRYLHVTQVEAVAETLAMRFGESPDNARTAGLLHDCAKEIPLREMQEEADRLGIDVDPLRFESGELLHAFVGAALLRERFGVTEPDVIHAVKYHNTGSTNMSRLDLIVYLADKIEPSSRKGYDNLERARKLAEYDLSEAVMQAMRNAIEFINSRGSKLHPDTPAALESLLKHSKV
ncbi:MAG: nicotinate-nucleotide adenylyltransferase [Oscillospiraceae bacterium]|nr:nicotinate-nucleotide adenylyltransferase [Oscillospiraceae bacterium]